MTRTSIPGAIAALALASGVMAQPTVPYTSPAWQDFGTTDMTGVLGNFLPGWTTVNATPDLGDDLFALPNESYSGLDDDAALWMLNYHPASLGATSTEIVELSLSGFTIGDAYEITFAATILQHSSAGWSGVSDELEATLTGASIATWTSSTLTDSGDADGMNVWVNQSIMFIATDTTVGIRFSDGSITTDANTVSRIGIDAFRGTRVPAPGSAGVLALLGAAAGRHRRR